MTNIKSILRRVAGVGSLLVAGFFANYVTDHATAQNTMAGQGDGKPKTIENNLTTASDDVKLSASDGIKWDRVSNNITAMGNSQLARQGLILKSQGAMMIMFKQNTPAQQRGKSQLDTIVAQTMAEIISDKLDGTAGQIKLLFAPDAIKIGNEVVQTINFMTNVVLVTKKNNASNGIGNATNMILHANQVVGYRNRRSQLNIANPVPRDIATNPFAELQATGAVKITEQQFNVKGERFVWFFDDALGWFYGQVVVVTASGNDSNSGNIVYAKKSLQYNQAANWARALNGVKVVTKKNETIIGQRGYYFPAKQQFIVCGQVTISRLTAKGRAEVIEGQCANSDFKTGISNIEGKNIENDLLLIVGADPLLLNSSSATNSGDARQPLKKLNNKPLDGRGRVRAIIDLE